MQNHYIPEAKEREAKSLILKWHISFTLYSLIVYILSIQYINNAFYVDQTWHFVKTTPFK